MPLYPPRQGTPGAPARFRCATDSAGGVRPPCRMAPIVTAAALLCAPAAGAEPSTPAYAPVLATRADLTLDPVIVTATRSRTALSRTPASVSVITDTDLEEQQADNIKEALRYEPGVTVRRSASGRHQRRPADRPAALAATRASTFAGWTATASC